MGSVDGDARDATLPPRGDTRTPPALAVTQLAPVFSRLVCSCVVCSVLPIILLLFDHIAMEHLRCESFGFTFGCRSVSDLEQISWSRWWAWMEEELPSSVPTEVREQIASY